ncbi:MAG: undecaprenyldiphospho-muramoylpentapeptide beta-N-acetylglucosaminyltransferase [Thermodesulfovibrionales bacterium]|nr:undecaprenyldiphospho-muramoylpentapeptide beta-N-acetylglucosaminyltransferase [Thermodesulfovibrionales bacterium]
MRVIIAGGGTGGHIFPGIAIAEELKRREDRTEVIFIGTEHGIEARIIPREGYPIKFLRAEGFVGVPLLRKIRALWKMLFSIIDSYGILKAVSPDIVIGVGGYASVGPMVAASMMSIPAMIVEQNSVPGLANKLLGKFAGAIGVTYQESISFFPRAKTFFTGNPIRMRILTGNRDAAYDIFSLDRNKFTLFVFGGSSGARNINRAVVDSFNHMLDLKEKIQFLHQTGDRDNEHVRESYRKWGFMGTVTPFIYQMAEAYAVADIVISRAGATTLAELTAIGKPAILIPYPYAAGHHQELNAGKLVELKAARIILDYELTGEILAENIRELYANKQLRHEMERQSRSVGKPDAAQKIVDIAISLIKKR